MFQKIRFLCRNHSAGDADPHCGADKQMCISNSSSIHTMSYQNQKGTKLKMASCGRNLFSVASFFFKMIFWWQLLLMFAFLCWAQPRCLRYWKYMDIELLRQMPCQMVSPLAICRLPQFPKMWPIFLQKSFLSSGSGSSALQSVSHILIFGKEYQACQK